MARRKNSGPLPPLWLGVVTVGELEKLAGVEDRVAFWHPFATAEHGFVAGIDALKAMINRDHAHVIEALISRGATVGRDGWRKELSDGTYAVLSFGEKNRISGDTDVCDWEVNHFETSGEGIGGGCGWDFAGALEALDGYIADPGWDRAPAPADAKAEA